MGSSRFWDRFIQHWRPLEPDAADDEWLETLQAGSRAMKSRWTLFSFLAGFWRRKLPNAAIATLDGLLAQLASGHQLLIGLVHAAKSMRRSTHIRMMALHQATEGLLDLLLGCTHLQTQHRQSLLLFAHCCS